MIYQHTKTQIVYSLIYPNLYFCYTGGAHYVCLEVHRLGDTVVLPCVEFFFFIINTESDASGTLVLGSVSGERRDLDLIIQPHYLLPLRTEYSSHL